MSYRGKKVIVSGGAGFIGSELVRQLVAQQAQVTVIDTLINGRRENLEGLFSDHTQLVVADIRDRGLIAELMRWVDIFFHMACLGVRHSIHSPQTNHEVNAGGTLSLLSVAREEEVKRFVYISSSEVYGTARRVPMSEEHPAFPSHIYGASKLAGECYTRAFYESYGFPTIVVRPFNTYGPRCHHEGDSGEVIPKFVLRCLAGQPMIIFGDGMQTRDFTYVSDMAEGILLAGLSNEAVGQTINLGNGHEISINDLAQEVASVVGRTDAKIRHDTPRPGDTGRLFADTAKAQKLLGYQPKVSLREGITTVKEWYLGLGISPEKLLEEEVVYNWKDPRIRVKANV